jgi:hypothetical protein
VSALLPAVPSAVFSELFPPHTVFAPRSTFQNIRWIFDDAVRLDPLTGLTMSIMGDMPLICHQNAATPLILDFFRQAGLEPASNIATYETEDEAIAIAREHIHRNQRIAYIYPPPSDLGESKGLLIPLPLYNWLNDKGNLEHLVETEYLPHYQIVPANCLMRLHDFLPRQEVFIKACYPGACGAGKDVLFCPDAEGRAAALQWFVSRMNGLSGIRIEAAVEVGSCWCLNLAILESSVRYLGAATQLFSEPAKQCGSRIDLGDLPPDPVVAIALVIADRARGMGYRGIAGFDIGVTSAGQPFVFDLNFRMASSTPQVLLHEAAVGRVNARISQSCDHMVNGELAPALNRLMDFARCGKFLPTRIYEATPATGGRSIITGIAVAATVDEVESIIAGIQAALRDFL